MPRTPPRLALAGIAFALSALGAGEYLHAAAEVAREEMTREPVVQLLRTEVPASPAAPAALRAADCTERREA